MPAVVSHLGRPSPEASASRSPPRTGSRSGGCGFPCRGRRRAACLEQEVLRGQGQPLDADEHLHSAVGGAVVRRKDSSLSASVSSCARPSATSFESTARMPIFSAASASAPSCRYMSLTAVTPHLIARCSCKRGPVRRLRAERPDHRVPAGLEVLPERQVVAPALADRGVVVQVDEPGEDDLVGGVENSSPSPFGASPVAISVILSSSMTTDASKCTSLSSFIVTTVAFLMMTRSLTAASRSSLGRESYIRSCPGESSRRP